MSTRGILGYAPARGEDWEGVYVHQDGYPSGLGATIWRELREQFRGDAHSFIGERILAHPGGYSGYPDSCSCHGREDGELGLVGSDTLLGHIEWVYVVNQEDSTLSVYRGLDHRGSNRWVLIATHSLWGPEPDWKLLERAPVPEPSGHSFPRLVGAPW